MNYPADEKVPKWVRQKIYNCTKAYKDSVRRPEDWASSLKAKGNAPYGAVMDKDRRRRRGNQGPGLKGKLLHYELKQEFIDFRMSVSARIWPKSVLKMALSIKERIEEKYKFFGMAIPAMPFLDLGIKGKKWLRRWRRRNGISFKKCQRKFKVSKAKILRRSKTTWLNTWAAMIVYHLLFGEARRKMHLNPWPYQDVRDQMGRMMNEAEAKNAPTLAFQGDDGGTGGLKTNHAQSRQRASMFTTVSNDPEYERGLEICFKLKTDRCLQDLIIPPGSNLTLTNSKSGSYDFETTLRYLDRWIPPWTEARAKIHDYRLVHLDDYAVHNMPVVKQFLKDRGCTRIKIGGGCTYALCGCDTDCHSTLQKDYMELDMEWAAQECKTRPWAVPVKSRQGFVNDWAVIWANFPHARAGTKSFQSNGLSARPPLRVTKADGSWEVPLVGPDDWRIGGNDAKGLFLENDMPTLRKKMLEVIYKDFDAGKIKTWSDMDNYQREHSDPSANFSKLQLRTYVRTYSFLNSAFA